MSGQKWSKLDLLFGSSCLVWHLLAFRLHLFALAIMRVRVTGRGSVRGSVRVRVRVRSRVRGRVSGQSLTLFLVVAASLGTSLPFASTSLPLRS
jgi:hypothetical protein